MNSVAIRTGKKKKKKVGKYEFIYLTNKQTIYMYQLDPSELDPSEPFAYSVNWKEILTWQK